MTDSRGFIIGVTSSKGGPGKSTTCQNLACEFARQGYKVSIIDADSQQSATNWADRRSQRPDFDTLPRVVVKTQSGDIRQSLEDEARLYDIILVDVAGRTSRELQSTLIVADLIIVPATASQKDLEVIPTIAQELHETAMKAPAHRKAYGFINKAEPSASISDIKADRDFFKHDAMQGAFEVFTTAVKNFPRAYDGADRAGVGVVENINLKTTQQSKAKAQIQVLAGDVQKVISQIINELSEGAA